MAQIDIRTIVGNGLDTAWDLVGQIVFSVTYRNHTGPSTYTPSTGDVTESVTDTVVQGMRLSPSADEIEAGLAQHTDVRWLVREADLDRATDVTIDDRIIEGSDVWQVIFHRFDPTKSLWTFITRRVEG